MPREEVSQVSRLRTRKTRKDGIQHQVRHEAATRRYWEAIRRRAFVDKQHRTVEEAYQGQQAHEESRGSRESAVPSVPIEGYRRAILRAKGGPRSRPQVPPPTPTDGTASELLRAFGNLRENRG
ncbi:hypothetical protein VTO73DRAFT_7403 [Trametes versicolor]